MPIVRSAIPILMILLSAVPALGHGAPAAAASAMVAVGGPRATSIALARLRPAYYLSELSSAAVPGRGAALPHGVRYLLMERS